VTRLVLSVLAWWMALAASAAVYAATAEEQFESVYGKEYRSAVMSRDAADDVSMATLLVSAARTATEADLKVLLCEKAYSLAMKDASGRPTALAAMDLLAEAVPARKTECLEKSAAVRQAEFNEAKGAAWNEAGEVLVRALLALAASKVEAEDVSGARGCVVRAKATAEKVRSPLVADAVAAADRVEVCGRLVPLKRAVEANAANRDAREKLMKIYLIEQDDPVSAAKYVERDRGDNLDKYILVAAMDPANVPERGLIELGDWYRGLADEAGPAGKGAMLRRAQRYYRRYLEVHTAADLERSKAEFGAQQVETALAGLQPALPPEAAWVDLLKLVNVPGHVLAGKWAAKGSGLAVSPFVDGYLAVPALPEGNYELQIAFTRATGSGRGIIIALPVGSGMALLRLAADPYSYYYYDYYSYSGLELVKGAEYHNNPTTRDAALSNNQRHTVEVAVTLNGAQAEVRIKMDGNDYMRWKGAQGDLVCPALRNRKQPPRAFGLGADSSAVLFDAARVRMTTGQLKRL